MEQFIRAVTEKQQQKADVIAAAGGICRVQEGEMEKLNWEGKEHMLYCIVLCVVVCCIVLCCCIYCDVL